MTRIIRVILVTLTVSLAPAFAQDRVQSNREFLKPIDGEKRADLMSRRALQIQSTEYFAKPGKFDIYEFDIDVLKSSGETITITPFNGPPIEIVSNGLQQHPVGWMVSNWSGEIKNPNSTETYPVLWTITKWSLDDFGNLQPPDPNREYVLSQMNEENAIIPEESYLRLNEKIVYAIHGTIRLPHTQTLIAISQLSNDLDFVMMYEVDDDKRLIHGDDTIDGIDLSEDGIERARRAEAYQNHVDNVRRELGLGPKPE